MSLKKVKLASPPLLRRWRWLPISLKKVEVAPHLS